jgi:predicted Zn-dependent protease
MMTNGARAMQAKQLMAAVAVLCAAILGGCGGGSGGNSSGGGAGGIAGTGITFGSLVPGKAGQFVDPIAKGASAVLMGEELEDEMGRTVAIAATNRWPLYDKPELNKYVTLVGLTVASASNRPDAQWLFAVLDTPEIGAYSGPGGYIMVTRGAIAIMEDESELAGILAHEISHVLNHDGLNAVKQAKFMEAGVDAAAASNQHFAAFNQATNFLTQKVLTSGWNQGQENAADAGAVQLLQAAGYDPTGLPRFLGRAQQRGAPRGGKIFGTHPGTPERISRTTNQIGGNKRGQTNRDRFAKFAAEAKL